MRYKFYILIILFFGLQSGLQAQNIDGLWKNTYMNPMTSYFHFDSLTSSFKYYYHDDLLGSFGKGNYKFDGNKVILEYDSIVCNKPIIELLDDDRMLDTTNIAFFHYWGFPKRIDILVNDNQIYSNWTISSDSIFEDYLFIKIPQKLDKIEVVIFDQNGSIDKEVARFNLRLFNKPYCNLYYYPCESWYKYEKSRTNVIKLKWKRLDFFEIMGKTKNGFQKIK